MVQRKLANKHGIQGDHVESKKGFSPSQNRENKKKGSDLRQKMKESRSIKHSDIESLSLTPPLRSKNIAQPAKPSTSDHVKTRTVTPQRQTPEESPNYMKSTSSFNARRERSQVSFQTPQNVILRKSMTPMKSNNFRRSSGSDNKPVGALAKASSLKLVRTLTKTPSFKPARASTKKYSPTALCEDLDVQKPTCSSTLKDSKMPKYLKLSAGATESEGTSAMKVCPYTYCSLNGHHHGPLPPLKSFLSAKRRMLKAQKVIKLGCLSPRRAKPPRERMVKIDAKQVILAEIPPTKGMDFDTRQVTPLMPEKKTDFFVEIYSNDWDDDTATAKGKTLESLSSTTPCSVIDFEENLEAEKDQNLKAGANIYSFSKTQQDELLDCLNTQYNTDEESQPISQNGQSDSEASEMEKEEEHHYKPSLNDVINLKLKVNDINNGLNIETLSKSGDNTKNSCEDILTYEVRVGFDNENSVSSGAWSDDGDSDMDGSYKNLVLDEPHLACNEQIQGKIYSTCDAVENITSLNEDENRESVETRVEEKSISHQLERFQAMSVEKSRVPEASYKIPKKNFQLGFDAIKCTSNVEEVLSGTQGDAQQECASWLLFKDFMEQDKNGKTHKDDNTIHSCKEVELDSKIESRSSDDVFNESFFAKIQYEDADLEDHEQMISTTDAGDGMEEKEPLATESFDEIRTFDSVEDNEKEKPSFESLQEFAKITWDKVTANKYQNKQTEVTTECETNQLHDAETLLYESNSVKNHEYPEMNQDQLQTYKFTSCKYSADHMHFGHEALKATPNQNQEADTGVGEYKTEPDVAETIIAAKASPSTQKRDYMSHASINSNEEMTQISKNLRWTPGSRKTVAELEDVRDFNPREPNYLPAEPDLEPEKVDLRHQLTDERKNSEEWMVDYALRQAVTKLAPAFRRKVSLLVEAFEKVLPTPEYETHPRHTSSAFVHARTVQAR